MTGLGGSSLVESARRTNESTITMRVKLVTVISIAGSSESTVSSTAISTAVESRPSSKPDSASASRPRESWSSAAVVPGTTSAELAGEGPYTAGSADCA